MCQSAHMAWNTYLQSISQDIRYSLRGFRREPIFALAAIAMLTIGIGATTAVFSVVDRILFRPLSYPESDMLVSIGLIAPIEPSEFMLGADYVEWRAAQTPFEALTSWSGVTDCDLTEDNAVRLRCAQVESSFLPAFGIRPLIGRNFSREEDRPNAPR